MKILDPLKHTTDKVFLIAIALKEWHDETNKMNVRKADTQISLGICPVWSVFTVCSVDK